MSNATFADVVHALARHAGRTSKAAANQVLESVAGTSSLRNVDPSLYGAAISALDGATSRRRDAEAPDISPESVYAHWNSFRRAPRDGGGYE